MNISFEHTPLQKSSIVYEMLCHVYVVGPEMYQFFRVSIKLNTDIFIMVTKASIFMRIYSLA